ncbi:MAG: thioredoxin family protein [Chloroflexi bacterium]|nr:thioredoxin family protein [Chloroflexota bacterium]
MLERLLIVLAAALLGFAICRLVLAVQRRRIVAEVDQSEVTQSLPLGVPTVLYFWTETCAPCELVQSPALDRIRNEFGAEGVQIVKINALAEPEMAQQWQVMTVPTTIIMDGKRQPRFINNRLVQYHELAQQLESVRNN